jgi:flagellar hook-associated protein 3 FlgL
MQVRLEGTPAAGDSFTVARSEKRNILDNIAMLRQNLETGGDTPEDKRMRSDVLSAALQNLDNGMNKVLSVQTTIGARMNVLESTANENAEISIINKTIKSGLEDLDFAEALSKLSLQSVVLQAAQQSFVKVSSMNLFNFLR